MKDLYELLPNIILYLASGYLFITTFKFVSWSSNEENIDAKFSLSIVCGFILKNFLCLFPARFNEYINICGLLLFSLVVGFIFGKIIRLECIKNILSKITNRTADTNIWHDLFDKDYKMWIYAQDLEHGISILGIIESIEENQRYPIIELKQYTVFDKDDDVIYDFTDDPTKHILINSEKYEITINYDQNSTHSLLTQIKD